ncbi:PREDICTED: rutC family protein HP_0944 [Papilio polytes]|uniref:rutC family protein HP_0944 n=1 Tax=Papilio polytes TaxID=76194 RepID=UPI0006769548|nr:PREDICTED: rutC family protein HP_0944 [Papilio polytes]
MNWRFSLRQTCYRFKSNMSKTSTKSSKVNKKAITSPDVYKPVGPYSQAVLTDKTLYVSGVLGLDTQSNMICGVEGQTRQALNNLKSILEAGESSLQGVLKTTILLTSMDDFPCVNKVYAEFFSDVYPARSTFQVVKLPLNALIEIEAIALIGIKEMACPCSR